MKIELKILNKEFYTDGSGPAANNYKGTWFPTYATIGSAGIDLVTTKNIILCPGETKAIHTGLAIHIGSQRSCLPEGWGLDYHMAGMIVPRSGLGSKGLVLANTIGIIDEDYQGEIIIQTWNKNNEYQTIDRQSREGSWQEIEWNTKDIIKLKAGDRIAQLIFVPIIKAQFDIVENFTHTTKRGDGGFGSTGE